MSLETFIQVIAQANGIPKLKDEIAQALSSDVEYRIREIIQDASKFTKHSKRKRLTTEDINYALYHKNVEPLYGYHSSSWQQNVSSFRKVHNTEDLYFIEDLEVEIDKILQVPLPNIPIGPRIMTHWLAIEGVQPRIPQNPKILIHSNQQRDAIISTSSIHTKEQNSSQATSSPSQISPLTTSMDNPNVEIISDVQQSKPLVKHILSAELQTYYEKVTEAIKSTTHENNALLKASLNSLSIDPGLHQLVPYFTQFISNEVIHHLRNLPRLRNLMEMVKSLLLNPHLQIELYLHQLMPTIFTCLVGKTLCTSPKQDHWSLRRLAAQILSLIWRNYSNTYHTLQVRITQTLINGLLDPNKPKSTHYGCIVGITELGPQVSQLLLLEPRTYSNLRAYWNCYLEPILQGTAESGYSLERHEALMCYGALLQAAKSLFHRLNTTFRSSIKNDSHRDANEVATCIVEEDDMDYIIESEAQKNSNQKKNEPKNGDDQLMEILKERMISLQVPGDIGERYDELYDIFGESLLPAIPYDVSRCSHHRLAMNVFI